MTRTEDNRTWIGNGVAFHTILVEDILDNRYLVVGRDPTAYGQLFEQVSFDSMEEAIQYAIRRDMEIYDAHELG